MDLHETPDLSSFYHHVLDYNQYVSLAYGLSLFILAILMIGVLSKNRRLKKDLAYFADISLRTPPR